MAVYNLFAVLGSIPVVSHPLYHHTYCNLLPVNMLGFSALNIQIFSRLFVTDCLLDIFQVSS